MDSIKHVINGLEAMVSVEEMVAVDTGLCRTWRGLPTQIEREVKLAREALLPPPRRRLRQPRPRRRMRRRRTNGFLATCLAAMRPRLRQFRARNPFATLGLLCSALLARPALAQTTFTGGCPEQCFTVSAVV